MSGRLGNPTLIAATLAAAYAGAPVLAAAATAPQVGPLLNLASYTFIDAAVSPAVARSSGGNFVVSWQPNAPASQTYGPAELQVFSADGTPLSSAISVGSRVVGNVAMAMDKTGNFVAAWTDGYSPGYSQLYAQRYSSSGAPEGGRKWLGTVYNGIDGVLPKTFFSKVSSPLQVAMDDDGDFVAAWTESKSTAIIENLYNIEYSSSSKTYAVAYRADGALLKRRALVEQVFPSGFTLGSVLPDADQLAAVTMNGKGDFALVYSSYRHGRPQAPIARFYSVDVTPLGGAQSLSAVYGPGIRASIMGFDATDTLVVGWNASDGTRWARYTADGSQVGAVAGPFGGYAYYCGVTLSVAPSGTTVLTWGVPIKVDPSGIGSLQTSCEEHGQYLNEDGTALGADFLIDGGTEQVNLVASRYASAIDGNGDLVLVWLATLANLTPEIVGRTVQAP